MTFHSDTLRYVTYMAILIALGFGGLFKLRNRPFAGIALGILSVLAVILSFNVVFMLLCNL